MVPNIEILKKDVINALVKFKEEGDMLEYSCSFVSTELTERYRKTFHCIYYRLTLEALNVSEYKDMYNKKSSFLPFSVCTYTPTQKKRLRDHFCRLTIQNLKSGLFDLDVKVYEETGHNVIIVNLILSK